MNKRYCFGKTTVTGSFHAIGLFGTYTTSMTKDKRYMAATTAETEEKGRKPESAGNRQLHAVPVHPIPQLQGPFEESIIESNNGTEYEWIVGIDAQTRRRDLLENAKYERLCGRRWRQRAGERYHPLWKLISQISFGVHLLAKGLAKSETEVMKILQGHVDELDEFVERTKEDFSLIQLDVRIRIRYLKLPLDNLDVFDEMLEDRTFRASIIDYNEKIEFAIERFAAAVNDSLKDIHKGTESIGALWHYVGQLAKERTPASSNLNVIYEAMIRNVNGWNIAFLKLHKRGTALASALSQLGIAVTEMQRRVGVASRKDVMMPLTEVPAVRPRSKSHRGRLFHRRASVAVSVPDKPLPSDPDLDAWITRSGPRQIEGRTMTRKSVPNLRAANESDSNHPAAESACRSMSLGGAADDNSHSGASAARSEKSLSKRFARSFRARRSISEKVATAQDQPVAASSSLKTRSVSLDRLKFISMNRKSRRQTMLESAALPEKQISSQSSTPGQNLRDQLSHYFKSDGAIDAWETSHNKDRKNFRFPSSRKKDWPLSMFRAKPPNTLHPPDEQSYGTEICPAELCGTEIDPPSQAPVFGDNLGRQMTWKQEEPDDLNTYWLKPTNHNTSPRMPVFSFPSILGEDRGPQRSKNRDGETVRAIAELP